MKITAEKFNGYITQFVKGHLIQNAKQPITKFKIGFALGTGRLVADEQMVNTAKTMGIADEEGNIDIDALKKATDGGMEAAGELHIPMLGIHLDKDDVGKFFHLVETGALS